MCFGFLKGTIVQIRVVLIPILVFKNFSNIAKAGIGIREYTSLCTDPIACDLLAAKRYRTTSWLTC